MNEFLKRMRNLRFSKLIGSAVFLLVIMFAAVFTLQHTSFAANDNADAGPGVKSEGDTFTVGFDASFPPYGYKDDDGNYVGFDLDLAQEVCKRNGWKYVPQPIDWDSKDMELKSGTIDCIWNGFTMNGRESEYTWSEPYVDNSQVVVVPSDSDIKTPDDLKGKVVIVQNDSSALAAFTGDDATEENKALAKSFKELQQVADYNTAFMNMDSGLADAVVLDIGVAAYQLDKRGSKYTMLDDHISSEQYGIGFKKGNTGLRDQVQASLNEMAEDGTFDKIAEKWTLTDSICLKDHMSDPYLGEDSTENNSDNDSSEVSTDTSSTDGSAEKALTGGKKAGDTFTVGFDASFPPYGYKDDDGNYIGFDLDLAQEVCKRNGWKYVPQPIDWDSKDMELKSGTIDCIWNGFTMNGRENDYTWSTPYVDNSQVVVVPADSEIKKLDDLKGKVVIVQNDSSALAAFTGGDATEENKALAKSFKELQQVADYNTAFMNMDSGLADAVVLDIGVAAYQLDKRGSKFKMLDEHVSSEQYGIGFKLGNYELRDQVQKSLNDMVTDGTFDKIAEKWNLTDSVCLADTMTMDFPDEKGADVNAVSEDTENSGADESDEDKSSFGSRLAAYSAEILKGLAATLAIFFLTLIFSLPLGLLVTVARRSRFAVLRGIMKVYISIMRGTPLMLQLLVVFFGPSYLFNMKLSYSYRFSAVIIGFAINYAAYFAEIFRAGFDNIPKGQTEAAKILGLTPFQTFCHITFPQMVKRVMPPVTNEVITLVKDTSLAYAISYTEMFTIAKQVSARETTIMPLFIAGVFYYVFNAVVAWEMSRIEKKMNYFE
jgi:His/Glu/Gln/Arg/opine family amino acid ABC transporter permease subunit